MKVTVRFCNEFTWVESDSACLVFARSRPARKCRLMVTVFWFYARNGFANTLVTEYLFAFKRFICHPTVGKCCWSPMAHLNSIYFLFV